MAIYSDVIRNRDKNNRLLEEFADRSLRENKNIFRLEGDVDDAQTAVLFILEKFGVTVDRQYGLRDVDVMIDTLLDPLGMMYDYTDSVTDFSGQKSEYILAFREDGKAVALFPSLTGYRYYSPCDSSSGFAGKAFCETLQKGCYIFHRPLPEGKSIMTTFTLHVLRSQNLRDILCLLAATGASTLLGFAIPAINRWIYKTYIPDPSGAAQWFTLAVLLYLSVIAARATIGAIKSMLLSSTKIRVSTKVQSAVMARVLHFPLSFFRQTTSGRLSSRIGNCTKLSESILDIVMDVLLNLSFSLSYLFQMRRLERALFLPAVVFLALRILASMISGLYNMSNRSQQMKVDMENSGFMYSVIRGIQKIKATGSEEIVYAKWADQYRRRLSLTYHKPFFLKYSSEIMSALATLSTIALLRQAMASGLSGGDYLTFTSSYALIITAVSALTDIMQNIFQVNSLCQNISPLFGAETKDNVTPEYVHRLRGEIRVEDIRFAYPGDPWGCLDGISLSIKPGEKIAIVGESGCGKSTLLKILMGMEMPDGGSVFYDGETLNSLNLKSLRRCMGSVFQFSRLFPGTIYENVCLGNKGRPDEEKVWEALDFAGCGDHIRSLPLQLETEISESNSCGFSGGQRQMILLARAVLNRPGVLILDEATSALDNLTQEHVLGNILQMRSTVIMVAHRLSTVVNFDRIIVLENGKIAEEGDYAALMEKDGVFAALVRKQLVEPQKREVSGSK